MSRTKGYKCFNIKCGSCIGKTLCGEPEDTALGCVDRIVGKPITNADRIRAMTDEELARFFIGDSPNYCHTGLCLDGENCIGCFLKWLQRPAEED